MDEKKNIGAPLLSAAVSDIEKLLFAADGNSALLYLHTLRNSGVLDTAAAADMLMMTESEAAAAAAKLGELGFLFSEAKKLPPPDELPDYSSGDITRRSREDAGFAAVLSETQQTMGRLLSGPELKTMLGIYDYLGIPAEVIHVLLHHCVDEFRERYGPGRLPTIRRVEKEAYFWAKHEIMTLDAAEKHLMFLRGKKELLSQIKTMLQIKDRDFSPTEREYAEAWTEMGFAVTALEEAYDRTIVKTGRLNWKYMDSILRSWHGKNLHTLREIQAGDTRPAVKNGRYDPGKNDRGGGAIKPEELAEADRLLAKIRNTR
ncbi:MAG: DnaD domain protein [Oscillospiraceae bacterium]|nr:DnaD domain protein [Oscillospiraceae bacterium]